KGPDESLVDDRLTWSGIASAKIPSVEQRYFHGLRPPRRDRKQGGHNRTRRCPAHRNKVLPGGARQPPPPRNRHPPNPGAHPPTQAGATRRPGRGAKPRHYAKQQQYAEDQRSAKTEHPPIRIEQQSHRSVGGLDHAHHKRSRSPRKQRSKPGSQRGQHSVLYQ